MHRCSSLLHATLNLHNPQPQRALFITTRKTRDAEHDFDEPFDVTFSWPISRAVLEIRHAASQALHRSVLPDQPTPSAHRGRLESTRRASDETPWHPDSGSFE